MAEENIMYERISRGYFGKKEQEIKTKSEQEAAWRTNEFELFK